MKHIHSKIKPQCWSFALIFWINWILYAWSFNLTYKIWTVDFRSCSSLLAVHGALLENFALYQLSHQSCYAYSFWDNTIHCRFLELFHPLLNWIYWWRFTSIFQTITYITSLSHLNSGNPKTYIAVCCTVCMSTVFFTSESLAKVFDT